MDSPGPRHIRNVHQPVYPLFHLHKRAEVGQVPHLAHHPGSHRIAFVQRFPGIRFDLFEAQRNLLFGLVDLQDHGFHDVSDGHHLGRMPDMLRPRHLRDVHQPLDALFQLHKRAVVGDAHHLAPHLFSDRIFLLHVLPRIGRQLLQSQRNPVPFGLVVEDLHLQLISDSDQLRGMTHPAPRHVRDVEQSIYTAQINEGSEVGDVLHHATSNLAHLQLRQDLFPPAFALLLQYHPPGHHDIAAAFVQFDDLERKNLADELIEVLHLTDVNLRTRQKRLHPHQIYDNAALDPSGQASFDHLAPFVRLPDPIPNPHEIGLLLGEDHLAFLILHVFQVHVHLIAYLDVFPAAELFDGNGAFRLETDIDHHVVLGEPKDGSRDDFPLDDALHGLVVQLLHLGEFFVRILLLFVNRPFGKGIFVAGCLYRFPVLFRLRFRDRVTPFRMRSGVFGNRFFLRRLQDFFLGHNPVPPLEGR